MGEKKYESKRSNSKKAKKDDRKTSVNYCIVYSINAISYSYRLRIIQQ